MSSTTTGRSTPWGRGQPEDEPSARDNPLLAVRNVEVRYQGSILAVKNVSLNVAEGEIVALLGPNGAGKSTVLKGISSLLDVDQGAVTEGSILFDGQPIHNSDPIDTVHRGVVQVLEGRPVLRHMTVEQNLAVASAAWGADRSQRREVLEEVYELFPLLADFSNAQAGYLSGGQQQMLVIGRALSCRPRLLLLDEPSLGLAPIIVREIFERISQVNKTWGTTILLVEQNARLALDAAQRGYVIEDGRIVLEGSTKELLNNDELMEFYLGVGHGADDHDYSKVKHYRRRKRWI